MLISAFFDESGKFRDKSTISFCGVADGTNDFGPFANAWTRELSRCGLKSLTMKEALNANRPLSKKRPAKGTEKRIEALMPFIECIRRHIGVVCSFAVDVKAFKAAPSEIRRLWGDNPHYFVFIRALMYVCEIVRSGDHISIVCDDEEETALEMYKQYRRVKMVWPVARAKCAALTFADDEVFVELQAADMIASLARLVARNALHGEPNDYLALHEGLKQASGNDKLWAFDSAIIDTASLVNIGNGLKKLGVSA